MNQADQKPKAMSRKPYHLPAKTMLSMANNNQEGALLFCCEVDHDDAMQALKRIQATTAR